MKIWISRQQAWFFTTPDQQVIVRRWVASRLSGQDGTNYTLVRPGWYVFAWLFGGIDRHEPSVWLDLEVAS